MLREIHKKIIKMEKKSMEVAVLGRSSHGVLVKQEKGVGESHHAHNKEDIVEMPVVTNMETSSIERHSVASSSISKEQDDKLGSARAEMSEVKEENQRLKMYLDQITKDYQTLQMQFHDIVQQESNKLTTKPSTNHQETEESDLVLLSLGRVSSERKKNESMKNSSQWKTDEQVSHNKEGLALGLDSKFEGSKSGTTEASPNPSPVNSFQEPNEEVKETWPPSKVLKTVRSGDDEVTQQSSAKKARVSVRARCDTPTMTDGCQWRKYGQKISKGNPCPRAYYRCTVAPNCPVRKQVQRCVDDMSILITTYEGQHNHRLPISATAMASTTSAAASMLLSGSSTSQSTTTSADLHGLNFYLTDNSKSKQFYLPNSSISSLPSHPTITLDLTSTPSTSSSHFNRFSSNYHTASKYSSTSLNFNASESNPIPWNNNGFLSYGNQVSQPLFNRNNPNIYQSYLHKNTNPSLPDTIAAATKAITADPSFQSALAAALTTIIGTGGSTSGSQGGRDNGGGQKMKWGEPFSGVSLPAAKGNGCGSSYLNKPATATTHSQPESLMFLPLSLPFSTSKSTSASPGGDNKDQGNL